MRTSFIKLSGRLKTQTTFNCCPSSVNIHELFYSSISDTVKCHIQLYGLYWFCDTFLSICLTHYQHIGTCVATGFFQWFASIYMIYHTTRKSTKKATAHNSPRSSFHQKHMILSCYMLSTWYVSTYMKHNMYLQSPLDLISGKIFGCELRNGTHTNKFTHLFPTRTKSEAHQYLHHLNAFQALPTKSGHNVFFDSDSFYICLDSGASTSCTMSMEDFIPDTYHKLSDVSITGISSALSVQGHGTVRDIRLEDLMMDCKSDQKSAYLPTEVSIARFNITRKIDSLC